MDLTEKTLDSERIYDGKIVRLRRDRVRLPNGRTSIREVVEHPGGVGIVAIDGQDRVLTVRQYRYTFSRVIEEIPAGKLEPGEDPRAAALRELREETGAVPARLESLGSLLASPGCYGEVLHLFLASDLRFEPPAPDEGEFVEPLRTPFEQLLERVLSGEIRDAKTAAGLLKVAVLRQRRAGA